MILKLNQQVKGLQSAKDQECLAKNKPMDLGTTCFKHKSVEGNFWYIYSRP